MKVIEVTPENALQETFFCMKDIKSKAFLNKFEWFKKRYKEGLKIKIIKTFGGLYNDQQGFMDSK